MVKFQCPYCNKTSWMSSHIISHLIKKHKKQLMNRLLVTLADELSTENKIYDQDDINNRTRDLEEAYQRSLSNLRADIKAKEKMDEIQ